MPRSNASGYSLSNSDVPTILGMVARGDRDHDIAGWFGVNQGRIKGAKDGQYGPGTPAPGNALPPKGPPGIKGRRLRGAVGKCLDILAKKGTAGMAEVQEILTDARARYDANEA
jgi:hypothetical protein